MVISVEQIIQGGEPAEVFVCKPFINFKFQE